MDKPDANAIAQEIAALRSLKPSIRQFSEIGDDNHAALEAQVLVLEQRMTLRQIMETWQIAPDSEEVDHENGHAILALAWMEGESEEPPSSEVEEKQAAEREQGSFLPEGAGFQRWPGPFP